MKTLKVETVYPVAFGTIEDVAYVDASEPWPA